MTIFRLMGRLVLILGLAMLAFAGYQAIDQIAFGLSAAHADGVVIDLVQDRRPGFPTRTVFAAVVEFRDAGGAMHRFVEPVSTNPPAYDRGAPVPVLYDPVVPDKAVIDGFWGRYFTAALFSGLGMILLILHAAFLSPTTLRRASGRYRDRLKQMEDAD